MCIDWRLYICNLDLMQWCTRLVFVTWTCLVLFRFLPFEWCGSVSLTVLLSLSVGVPGSVYLWLCCICVFPLELVLLASPRYV